MKRPHHWHVEVGLSGGYLPDDIACFSTRKAAEQFAVQEAHEHVDAGYVVHGSARSGRYDAGWPDGDSFRHILIERHDSAECDWQEE
jgi:hypothetical protein